MAKQNRTVLKTYFESGDIPNQSQYSDLIDSNLNLSENNTGNINLTGDITASGNISASGTIFADNFQSTGGDVAGISFTDDLNLTGNITASGNISASGQMFSDRYRFTSANNNDYVGLISDGVVLKSNLSRIKLTGHVTASGDISSSGNIIGGQLKSDGRIYSNNRVGVYNTDSTNFLAISTHPTEINGTNITLDAPVTASGNISASGTITGQNIILGSGGEINVKDTSGNNELVLINNTDTFLGFGDTDQELRIQGSSVEIISSFTSSQDALFTNDVTFEQNITASGDIIASDLILTSPNGSKFKFTVNNSGHLSLTGSAV